MAANSEAAVLTPTADYQETEPANKKQNKGFLKRVFNKSADMAGRAAVTGVLKIAAVTTLAGLGASGLVTIGAASVASGFGAALYVYAKDTFADWRLARREGRDISWWNKDRARKMRIALLTGAAGGAFGAWLAGTDFFKAALDVAKETAGKLLSMVIEGAHAAPAVSVPVAPVLHEAMVAPAHAPAAAVPPVDIPAQATPNVLGRLWGMAMNSEQAHGKLMATLLKADPDNVNSVSPQFLKDRAHDVLRLKDVPWKDRLALAHDLAEAAKERGNKQAVQFLKDLVKLEHGAAPHFNAAAHHVAALPAHEAAHVVPDAVPAPDVTPPAPIEAVPLPPTLQFTEAATCRLAANATGSTGVDCVVNKASMQAGDYIGFVAAENPAVKVTTLLADGSTEVPTQSFLHERIIADGVARLDQVRATLKLAVPTP